MTALRSPDLALRRATEAEPAPRPIGRPRCEASRLRILAAARELLEEEGFRAMTMEGIAERAKTSKVTVYRWWSHKAAVVLDAMLADVSPVMPYRDSSSALESLGDQMKSFTRFLRSRKARLLAAVLAEGVVDEEVGQAFREHWVRPRRNDARKLLWRAVEAGELRPDVDLEVVLDALFGPLYYRALVNHLPLERAFAEKIFEGVVLGVATPGFHRARSRRVTEKQTPKKKTCTEQ
jgi:AcrR family transcriptional regulator